MITIKRKTLYLLVFITILSIISFFIIRKFIIPIIFTGILVMLFHPLYTKLLGYFRSHFLTSFIMFLMIGLIIIVPMILTVSEITKEFSALKDVDIEHSLDVGSAKINDKYGTNIDLKEKYFEFLDKVSDYLTGLLYNKLPEFIFNVFIIMFFFYYFMKNYDKESAYFAIILKRIKILKISYKVQKLINGIIYGQILVRFIQALFGAILFLFIGVEGAFFWGVLMFFASFIPLIGTSLIWGPLVLLNFFLGNHELSLSILIAGILISTIDNLLFPFIISERINIGPVVTLISIIGGIELFGIYGIILGPFFLGLLFVFIDELILKYRSDNNRKRYVWTQAERSKYKSLKTQEAKREFARMLDRKYQSVATEKESERKVEFRYVL